MAILFASTRAEHLRNWLAPLRAALGETPVWQWPDDVVDPAQVTHAIVWKPPRQVFAGLSNLRAVFSLGAGVDDLLTSGVLPGSVPLVRMVDPSLTAGIVEYVLLHVLSLHRQIPQYRAQQARGLWQQLAQRQASEVTVGFLGLGVLGQHAADAVAQLGFRTIGYTRSPRPPGPIPCMHGPGGWETFLSQTDILVCLVPKTPATLGMLDGDAFARLPRGAALIQASRGGIVIEQDLCEALDSGQLSHAVLDVFNREPLPQDDCLWRHPKVTVTPHVAAVTVPTTAIASVVDNLNREARGLALRHVVDRARGY